MKTKAWHSSRDGTVVYHDNAACTEGNNIEQRWRATGTGGLRRCDHCSFLDRLTDILAGR